VHLRHFLV